MSRLVAIDEVIRVAENTFPKEDVRKIMWVLCHTPTAYDVEKVVAELEELANHYHKCCLVDYNEGAEVGVRETMAIVRKGGVE